MGRDPPILPAVSGHAKILRHVTSVGDARPADRPDTPSPDPPNGPLPKHKNSVTFLTLWGHDLPPDYVPTFLENVYL